MNFNVSTKTIFNVFSRCINAIQEGKLIVRESKNDKEFHFQNWFKNRLEEVGFNFDQGGRNTYPDFSMVKFTEGYEIKGLAYPGRDATFDSNSQIPTGFHNGRSIYYVFGRYPKNPDGNSFPVLDLVICHGDFLNADHEYVHKNKNVKGFGTYGDIMIRDRKMYVVPTPFRLVEGAAHQHTLILPRDFNPGEEFIQVGELKRTEVAELIVGYSFDLQNNVITAQKMPNPNAGTEHVFCAWRLRGSSTEPVTMRENGTLPIETTDDDHEEIN